MLAQEHSCKQAALFARPKQNKAYAEHSQNHS